MTGRIDPAIHSATTTTTLVPFPFPLVLVAEAVALCVGQRRLFWLAVDATGSRLLGYLLAMPGTVLHESAHYLACRVLGTAPSIGVPSSEWVPGMVRLLAFGFGFSPSRARACRW